jgi:CRP-like cAMP-binding protein
MNEQQRRLAGIIQKINIFKGLGLQDVQQNLQVCKMRNFQPNEEVYKAGAQSDEMLILLKGQLMVSSASGEPLGSVTAGNSIGEMGVFTGQPRSTTVTATTEVGGVAIPKIDVDLLMTRNAGMYVKVLQNIIGILSEWLTQANTQNEQHMKTIMGMRNQIERLM